ncbi:hypothetical protein TNCT_193391 [Trichonephila clavata]|uniref:Uncharacterized protein n=1 Tax=Trichonephila clavata TaxID=2740835 RepID=A0A8X6FB08_TRICU|nr:hypothetical protein TNCT_193391 [Trichonephila clavata]
MSTIDEQRSGRPLSVRPDLARAVSEQFMDEDRRCSLLELERASGIERYPHRHREASSTGYCVMNYTSQNRIAVGTACTDGS